MNQPLDKIFHFDSPRDRYHCDAAVVACFDNRFDLVFRKFLVRNGFEKTDVIKLAGGAKCLASGDSPLERDFVLDQIRLSRLLHGTRNVVLMLHSDCGAYGGLDGAFNNDEQAEAAHHEEQLRRAASTVREAIHGMEVEAYFLDFAGVWKVNLGRS